MRRLTGRLVLRDDDQWVIEVDVEGALDWAPPAEVKVTLADGRTVACTVDFAVTTAAGPLQSGQTARLALRHGESALPVSVDLDGLVITL